MAVQPPNPSQQTKQNHFEYFERLLLITEFIGLISAIFLPALAPQISPEQSSKYLIVFLSLVLAIFFIIIAYRSLQIPRLFRSRALVKQHLKHPLWGWLWIALAVISIYIAYLYADRYIFYTAPDFYIELSNQVSCTEGFPTVGGKPFIFDVVVIAPPSAHPLTIDHWSAFGEPPVEATLEHDKFRATYEVKPLTQGPYNLTVTAKDEKGVPHEKTQQFCWPREG